MDNYFILISPDLIYLFLSKIPGNPSHRPTLAVYEERANF